ncbi:11522_t:CDS:2, partial [Dentiscutata erythropus]
FLNSYQNDPFKACKNNKVPINIFLDQSPNTSFKLFNNLTLSTTSCLKVLEPSTKKGSRPISPITIPPVEQDNVSKPFEELEYYASQLKTQLSGSVKKIVEKLNFPSNSSSNPPLVTTSDKISIEFSQPLSLNYIRKELSLAFLNFKFSLLVHYEELILKSETSLSLNRTTVNNNFPDSFNNLQNSLGTTTQYNRIVSPFIYVSAWKHKVSEYQFNENDSDADEIIDENVKPDLRGYISNKISKEEFSPIKDIFDYYYGEEVGRQNTFNIGPLESSFDRIDIDIVGPLPITSTNKRYIVVATEYLTKWPDACTLESADAENVAIFIYEDLICQHGSPNEILSDRGTHFCNKLITGLCKKISITYHTSIAYYHQTNSLVERFNKTLCEVL